MTGDQVTVNMTGGCPWGFRLYGGDEDPLVVAKLRKRSKAHDSGLQEGDVLLGINGHSCQSMTHSTAMSLADGSGQNLTLLVLRGTSEKYAVHAAFQALGSQLKQVPASALPQARSSGSNQVPSFQSSEQSQPQSHGQGAPPGYQVQVRGSPFQSVVNGAPGSDVRREEHTLQDGNTTKHIKTETRTEQFGSTKLTKITREEVSHTMGGGGFAPHHEEPRQPTFSAAPHGSSQPPSMFQVSNFGSNKPKPGAWAPSGAPTTVKAGAMIVTAPTGVHVQQHSDQSVTMTIGMQPNEGKENVAPHFNVSQAGAPKAKPSVWQPSYIPPPPKPRPPSPPMQEPMQEDSTDFPTWAFPGGQPFHRDNAPPALPMHLTRILHEGSGSDECSTPDTPTGMSKKKKLLFGDSAFYDDPQHKYPTIEEQVKMARRVAMSLTSPANTKARGHRMFVKRQQKSVKWTKGEEPDVTTFTTTETYDLNDSDEEKFFQPDPWAPKPHTWQPSLPLNPVRRGEIPIAPPVPMLPNMWAAPVIPKVAEEKTKALSAEEFERMRLYESKTQHTAVSPQACFALADDLHKMKGKGGRLFAKRKARAEKWVVGESTAPPAPNAEFMKKLTGGLQVGVPQEPVADVRQGAVPVNKLKQMIDIPKPAMTPWEAAMESGGNIERAFQHLEGITFTRKTGAPGAPTVAQDVSSPTSSMSTTSSMGGGPSKMPEFSRKIKPWGDSPQPAPSTAPKPSPRPPPKSWQGGQPGGGGGGGGGAGGGGSAWSQPEPSGGAGGGGNFRPINFRASGPGGSNKAGVFAPWQPNSSGGGGGGGGGGGAGPAQQQPLVAGGDGFCDL